MALGRPPLILGSLSNHDDDGNKNPTNLHIWQWKTVFLHALHVYISSFDILKTFSFFLRREITCFAVVWTTWAYVDTFCPLCPKRWFQINSRHFSSIMTLNNWKIIAEKRSYIFRWRSRFRRRRVCLSSLLCFVVGALIVIAVTACAWDLAELEHSSRTFWSLKIRIQIGVSFFRSEKLLFKI